MLEGTVNTPFGSVSKKTAALIGAGVIVVAGIVYYRGKKASLAEAAIAEAGQSDINPATGFPYGSAEDAAALAAQASFISPTGGGVGGGPSGSIPTTGTGFATNAEWSQFVITYMDTNDVVADIGPLSAALGAYLTGKPPTADGISLIQQAIAIAGYPPVPGANGYPPSINTNTSVPDAPTTLTAPTGITAIQPNDPTTPRVILTWNPVDDAALYVVGIRAWGSPAYNARSGYDGLFTTGPTANWTTGGFNKGQGYDFYVAAKDAGGKQGPFGGPARLLVK